MARKPKKNSDLSQTQSPASPARPGARARKASPAKKPGAESKSKPHEQIQLQQQDFESAVAEESGVHVTHDQIQAKAQEIWHSRGCPTGQDLQIWLEAEKALQR